MSNFAERLIARSVGTLPAPGFSMLRPRPVSRFEPMAGLEIDAAVDAAPPAAHETEVTAPAVVRSPIERRESHTPKNEVPDIIARPPERDAQVPRQETAQSPPPLTDEARQARPAPASRGRETFAAPAHVPEAHVAADVADTHEIPQSPAIESIAPMARESAREIHTARGEQLAVVARERLPMIGEAKAEQPPAPTISIGRIEVQFLPQETRSPAPQPERTRGFAAYARARRGEPR